jgi:hypothetical protein
MITWTVMGLILIALWFWFDSWIAVRGLAISSRGNWDLVASGWHVVLSLWPLTLLGGLIGGTAAWAVASYLWLYITDVEHRREIAAHTANCEQRVQAASARAEQAEQRAANAMALATQQAEDNLRPCDRKRNDNFSKPRRCTARHRPNRHDAPRYTPSWRTSVPKPSGKPPKRGPCCNALTKSCVSTTKPTLKTTIDIAT